MIFPSIECPPRARNTSPTPSQALGTTKPPVLPASSEASGKARPTIDAFECLDYVLGIFERELPDYHDRSWVSHETLAIISEYFIRLERRLTKHLSLGVINAKLLSGSRRYFAIILHLYMGSIYQRIPRQMNDRSEMTA